jgi:hypothetical protein
MLNATNVEVVWFLRRIIRYIPNGEGTGQGEPILLQQAAIETKIFEPG